MPLTHHMKQTIDQEENDQRNAFVTAFRIPTRKAPGTRLGILQNWRGESTLKSSGRFGTTFRDGR